MFATKIEVVKFKDGKYGIRKTLWFVNYVFYDFASPVNWWKITSRWINDCKVDKDVAMETYNRLYNPDLGQPI